MSDKKIIRYILIGLFIFMIVVILRGGVARWKAERSGSQPNGSGSVENDYSSVETGMSETVDETEEVYSNESYEEMLSNQKSRIALYGDLPEGFYWGDDGELLSSGDKSMSAEDVLYAYFRGISSLDMTTVQRYVRKSKVLSRYSGYFDTADSSANDASYYDQFVRNMYKQALLSLQIDGVENQSVFADNRVVFSVKASMLDLTDKDFWLDDKEEIYKNLYLYSSMEEDSTKKNIYIYDYILKYYQSDDASRRDVSFDITLKKFADTDSGWLVCIDNDVDNACIYQDGNLVVTYINSMYDNEGRDMIDAQYHPEDYDVYDTEYSSDMYDLDENMIEDADVEGLSEAETEYGTEDSSVKRARDMVGKVGSIVGSQGSRGSETDETEEWENWEEETFGSADSGSESKGMLDRLAGNGGR